MLKKISIKNKINRSLLLGEFSKSYNHFCTLDYIVSHSQYDKDDAVFISLNNKLICIYIINKRRIRIIYYFPHITDNVIHLEYDPLVFFDVVVNYLRKVLKWKDDSIQALIQNTGVTAFPRHLHSETNGALSAREDLCGSSGTRTPDYDLWTL